MILAPEKSRSSKHYTRVPPPQKGSCYDIASARFSCINEGGKSCLFNCFPEHRPIRRVRTSWMLANVRDLCMMELMLLLLLYCRLPVYVCFVQVVLFVYCDHTHTHTYTYMMNIHLLRTTSSTNPILHTFFFFGKNAKKIDETVSSVLILSTFQLRDF